MKPPAARPDATTQTDDLHAVFKLVVTSQHEQAIRVVSTGANDVHEFLLKSTKLCESEIEQRHVLLKTKGVPKHYFDQLTPSPVGSCQNVGRSRTDLATGGTP